MKMSNPQLKIWIPALTGLLLVVFLAPIKQLSFVGISHCGRVLSDIQKEERDIDFFFFGTGEANRFRVNAGSVLDTAMRGLPENLDVIWTIGMNNQSCFSYSQRAYLSQFKEVDFRASIFRGAGLYGCDGKGCYEEIYAGTYIPVSEK
jgi:hypothetical protein